MNIFFPFIKNSRRIPALMLVGVLCFFHSDCFSQSVNITVNITPPYSSFYSDYSGVNASKVFLTLQNLTNTTKNIKLTGQLEGDNGIRITTKSNYVPLQPIVLNPNQVRQLNGLALKDIFDVNTLNVYGVDKVKLVQTSRLPEGNYTFCIQAVDMATNQVISSTAPLGCTTISIAYPDAPVLIGPMANATLNATTPQSVVFNWINAGFAPIGTQYVLQVAEMPLGTRDPNQLLNSVSFPLLNKTLNGFSYVLSPADPPLVIGKKYAWRVKAVDPTGKTVFKNNGISAANTFTYQAPIVLANTPLIISPNQTQVSPSLSQNLAFRWSDIKSRTGITNYQFQLVELANAAENPQKIFDKGTFLTNTSTLETSHINTVALKLGKRYAWRVKATDLSGITQFKNNGFSEIATFDCVEIKGATEDLIARPKINSPVNNQLIAQTAALEPAAVKIEWTAPGITYPATYKLLVTKLQPGVEPAVALAANLQLIHNSSETFKTTGATPTVNRATTVSNLEDGGTYAAWILAEAKNEKGEALRFDNLGRSNIITFTYKAQPKNNVEPPAPIFSTINGRFLYRFKEDNEQPTQSSLGFAPVTSKQVFGATYSSTPKFIDKVQYSDYPDYAASGRFALRGNEKPLKNVTVYFTYTLLQSVTKNPKTYADLKEVGNLNSSFELGKYLDIDGEKIVFDKVVYTTKLKPDGSFNITFTNKYKLGYIGTKNGKSYFGVIRPLISENGYFTTSEILLFPKVGKTTTLTDEVVFVKTYNLNVKVIADKKIKSQAVNPGEPLSNYPMQLLDQPKYAGKQHNGAPYYNMITDEADNLETMPWEANAEHYVGQTQYNKEPNSQAEDLAIVDMVKTSEIGIASFKNLLITHTHLPYLAVNPFEGNFNYKPIFGELIKAGTANDEAGIINGEASFNSNFVPQTLSREIAAKPKKPEIYLRAITVQNNVPMGIPYAYVTITTYKGSSVTEDTYKTDINGYLQLTDLQEGVLRTIVISKFGFQDKWVATKQDIQLGERFPQSVEQELKGAGAVTGIVVNEKGQPVVANVRVGNGPFIKTLTNGFFLIENAATLGQPVQIVPVVDNYFAETLYPYIKANDYTLVTTPNGTATGKIILKEKLHRVQFKIVDENGNPVKKSDVGIGNNTLAYYSSDPYTGITPEIAFASPDNEFKVRVVANGYVTHDDYVKIDISKTAKLITIKLAKGQIVSGFVRDAATGAPIANARVYTVSGINDDGEIQNSVNTDANGKYTLYGAINPKMWFAAYQFYQDLPIKVYAVKSGEPGYIMEVKSVIGYNGSATADFNLQKLTQKAEIWGLPIEVHSLYRPNYYTSVITGAFTKLPANNNFKQELADVKLPFKQLATTAVANGGFAPAATSIEVQTAALKVKAFDQFGAEVIGSDKENTFINLTITNRNGVGSLVGYVTSELSSFNFSYNYNGKFLLGNAFRTPGGTGVQVTPSLVFSANPNLVTETKYKVNPLYGKSSFNIHNFNASLKTGSDSYLDKTGYNLAANVNLNIPLVGVNTLPAGQFKVTGNNIVWSQYNGDINIPLESWTLSGKGLQYEMNQGGFRVLQGNLKTDLPQVALTDLLIMPNTIDLGETKLTGKESMSLANVTPLNLAPDAKMTLNYDAAAPFDQKPHYRLNLAGSGKSVAYINNLPGMGSSKININMLSAYSDGKHKTILVEPTKVNYFNVISQTVAGIEVANDFFTLIGNTNLEIPGAAANVTGRFKYLKNPFDKNADKNGVVLNIEKLQTDVEMEGKVKFEGLSYEIAENLLKVNGNVHIYKNTLSDAIKGIRGILTKTPSQIEMAFLPEQKITMGSKAMLITQGGSKVQGNKWDLVQFTGQPKGYGETNKDLFKKDANLIDFTVNGAIENVKNNKQIQLDGISTPFGDLKLTFDFENAIFNGSLAFQNANIVLGYITIQDGTADLQIDKNGVLVIGAITNAEINAPLPNFLRSNFKSGMALGYYGASIPSYLRTKLAGVTLYELPASFNNGLKGFYINTMKSLSKADLPKLPGPTLDDIPIVGKFVPVFDFSAGVDAYFIVDFNNSLKVDVGGKAFANASFLYDLELCTIGLSGGASGAFNLKYENSSLQGFLDFGIKAAVSYCLGSLPVGISLRMEKDANGFKFKPSLN